MRQVIQPALSNPEIGAMQGVLKQINRSNGGMPKRAIAGPVMLNVTGIEGDRQRNLKYHGGPDKAVLVIAAEAVKYLTALGYPLFDGALGENLTVAGLDSSRWCAGQRYRVGEDAVIELTTLRRPCTQLYVYGESLNKELGEGRGGFYARVIKPGLLVAGAPITLVSELA